jgi:hypothetical protein
LQPFAGCRQYRIPAGNAAVRSKIIFFKKNWKMILTNQNNSPAKETWGFAACRPVNKTLTYDILLNTEDFINYQKTGNVTKILDIRHIRALVSGVIHKVINSFCG